MLSKKPAARMVSAVILTGSLLGAGATFSIEPVEAASTMDSASAIAKDHALTTLHEIYNKAFSGEMPYTAMGLKINENTQKDVYETFGPPPEPGNTDETFDYSMQKWGIQVLHLPITLTRPSHKSDISGQMWNGTII